MRLVPPNSSISLRSRNFIKWDFYKRRTHATKKLTRRISYTMSFRSLFPFSLPSILFSVSGLNSSSLISRKSGFERLVVKNSYLLFTWFYYLNSVVTKGVKFKSEDVPSFCTKPTKVSKFTITKAPMAHKTFSQEQYRIKFYNFLFKFSFLTAGSLDSLNHSMALVNFFRYSFFFFETNFFFLNRLQLSFISSDAKFLVVM